MTPEKVVQQFKAFLQDRNPDATRIEIGSLRQIHGGGSRQTFGMDLNITKKSGQISRKVILRLEFDKGIIETQTKTEWDAYTAFANTEIPVPEMIWLEEDHKWMGSPFFVMEEIVGCQSAIALFSEPPFNQVREKIGERFSEIMGAISKTDPRSIGLEQKLDRPAPNECWKKELDFWEADINEKELEPHPLVRAAIRWLRKNPPPPAQKVVVVHGDIRAGNFMYNEKGEIKAILDWELMHIGDPLEDLAWALNRLWSQDEPDRLGMMLPRDRAIKIWEETSGFNADPEALFWWEVFTSIKAMAIWISMNNVYATGGNSDAIIAWGGIMAHDTQSRILINQMREVI